MMTDYMERVRGHAEENQCIPENRQHLGPTEVILDARRTTAADFWRRDKPNVLSPVNIPDL